MQSPLPRALQSYCEGMLQPGGDKMLLSYFPAPHGKPVNECSYWQPALSPPYGDQKWGASLAEESIGCVLYFLFQDQDSQTRLEASAVNDRSPTLPYLGVTGVRRAAFLGPRAVTESHCCSQLPSVLFRLLPHVVQVALSAAAAPCWLSGSQMPFPPLPWEWEGRTEHYGRLED